MESESSTGDLTKMFKIHSVSLIRKIKNAKVPDAIKNIILEPSFSFDSASL